MQKHIMLFWESKLIHKLRGKTFVPFLHFVGDEKTDDGKIYHVMIMDLLGKSLEDLFSDCKRKFDLKTVCFIAHQMVCNNGFRLTLYCRFNVFKKFMRSELFIETLNQIISWLGPVRILRTLFTLLTLVLPSVTKIQKVYIYPLLREKIWLVQQDTHQLTHTLGLNSQGVMIWKQLDMYCYTFYSDNYHGRDFQADQKMKNTTTLRRRNKRYQSMSYVWISQLSLKNSCSIVGLYRSLQIRTTITY